MPLRGDILVNEGVLIEDDSFWLIWCRKGQAFAYCRDQQGVKVRVASIVVEVELATAFNTGFHVCLVSNHGQSRFILNANNYLINSYFSIKIILLGVFML